jgi:diguanylate cyclase (GGDEF)-like protein/PAS domain S-box-containing protein
MNQNIPQKEDRIKSAHELVKEMELRVRIRTAELAQVNEELQKAVVGHKKARERLTKIIDCFLNFIPDPLYNINLLTKLCGELMGADCALYNRLYEGMLCSWGQWNVPRDYKSVDSPKGHICFDVINRGTDEPLVVNNLQESRYFNTDPNVAAYKLQTYVGQPVKCDGKFIGSLCVVYQRSFTPSDDDMRIIKAVGSAICIEEKRKQSKDALKEAELFLSNIFSSIQDGISILDNKMNIVSVNPTMEKWYSHSMPLIGKKCFEAYHGTDKVCKVCPTMKTIKFQESAHDMIPKRGPGGVIEGWFDLYSFPLIDRRTGKMTGVIEYVRDISKQKEAELEKGKLTEELLKTNKRLKDLALTDAHTGLYNHRFLEDAIEAEFYRAKRYIHPLSVITIDIDYFRSINDLYGHQFGDHVLKQFAKELKKMIRRYDLVIRSGGEEFVVVSPNVDRPQALAVAQRLLEAFNLCNFGDKKHQVKLKLSVAVASYPEDKISKGMDLINLAERILDKAKESGGNRVYSSLDMGAKNIITPALGAASKDKNIRQLRVKIEKLNRKTNQNLMQAIFALAKTIELKDHTTGEHVERTVHYVMQIAKCMDFSSEDIELLKEAAILHDLGKIGISESILNKKTKLTKKEYDEIKKHPQIGADILRPVQFLRNLIPFIFYHHERWDGLGYPTGIRGEEIPLGARIIAIADVFEALTSDRPYRKAYTRDKAVSIIKKGAGTQFDPRVVTVFLKILREESSSPAKGLAKF